MTNAARLRITLIDFDPAPWCEIEVPLSMSFQDLHAAIQAAFLWVDMHLGVRLRRPSLWSAL